MAGVEERSFVVTEADRERMRRLGELLREEESFDNGDDEWNERTLAEVNARRAAKGVPPLKEWWETSTEPELHERARALGLLERRR